MDFNKTLGIRVIEKSDDGVVLEMPIRPDMLNGAGVLHGGVTATLADAAMGVAISSRWPGRGTTTVELKINYLRPVKDGTLTARSSYIKVGRTLVIGQADLHDAEGRHIAVALLTYMMLS